MPVSKVFARQIFDSRGNPTVEVDVETEKGKFSFGEFLLAHNQGFLQDPGARNSPAYNDAITRLLLHSKHNLAIS